MEQVDDWSLVEELKPQRKRAAKSNGKAKGAEEAEGTSSAVGKEEGMLTSNNAYMLFYTKKGRKPIASGDLSHLQAMEEQVKKENQELQSELVKWQQEKKVTPQPIHSHHSCAQGKEEAAAKREQLCQKLIEPDEEPGAK